MEQQNQAILTTELSEQIVACTFSKADLQSLCEKLQESSYEAAEEEINHYMPLDRPPEQILADRETLRSGFELHVAVRGIGDKQVVGTIPVVFNSPRFPEKVKGLYIDSAINLKNLYNWSPRNHFELILDFTKPEPFNLSLSPSAPTPNGSNIFVSGRNETWVNGVYHAVMEFVKNRKTRRRFLHKRGIYDVLVIFIGFPFAFWITFRLSEWINSLFDGFSVFVRNGAYVFLFLVSLNIFKALFDYARWTFPILEYKGATDTARKHRYFLGTLAIAVFGNFLYDLIKSMAALIQ